MRDDRERLRTTFDVVAEKYARNRPEYPAALFDALIGAADARAGEHVLEIGCGTGQATLPLLERGLRVTCVELGANLAATARRILDELPDVVVLHSSFEAWQPPKGATYDLVVAASSWRWLDPDVKYRLAWEVLRPAGHLAFWTATHIFPEGGDP